MYIDVPDVIDISHMRSKGLQPGEELLPDSGMFCYIYLEEWCFSSSNSLE